MKDVFRTPEPKPCNDNMIIRGSARDLFKIAFRALIQALKNVFLSRFTKVEYAIIVKNVQVTKETC